MHFHAGTQKREDQKYKKVAVELWYQRRLAIPGILHYNVMHVCIPAQERGNEINLFTPVLTWLLKKILLSIILSFSSSAADCFSSSGVRLLEQQPTCPMMRTMNGSWIWAKKRRKNSATTVMAPSRLRHCPKTTRRNIAACSATDVTTKECSSCGV